MEITLDEVDGTDGSRGIVVKVTKDNALVFTSTEGGPKERFSRFTAIKALFYRMQDTGVFADEAPF